jgi:hypothetical protein
MPLVYVPHPVLDDIGSAEQWGRLKFINDRYIYPDEVDDTGQIPTLFYSRMLAAVSEFNPEDYLLIVGDHLQLVYLSALLGRALPRFKVLRYVKAATGYMPVHLTGIGPRDPGPSGGV